jgi:hypothetical protein
MASGTAHHRHATDWTRVFLEGFRRRYRILPRAVNENPAVRRNRSTSPNLPRISVKIKNPGLTVVESAPPLVLYCRQPARAPQSTLVGEHTRRGGLDARHQDDCCVRGRRISLDNRANRLRTDYPATAAPGCRDSDSPASGCRVGGRALAVELPSAPPRLGRGTLEGQAVAPPARGGQAQSDSSPPIDLGGPPPPATEPSITKGHVQRRESRWTKERHLLTNARRFPQAHPEVP